MLLSCLERLLVSALHRVVTLLHMHKTLFTAVCEKAAHKYRKGKYQTMRLKQAFKEMQCAASGYAL